MVDRFPELAPAPSKSYTRRNFTILGGLALAGLAAYGYRDRLLPRPATPAPEQSELDKLFPKTPLGQQLRTQYVDLVTHIYTAPINPNQPLGRTWADEMIADGFRFSVDFLGLTPVMGTLTSVVTQDYPLQMRLYPHIDARTQTPRNEGSFPWPYRPGTATFHFKIAKWQTGGRGKEEEWAAPYIPDKGWRFPCILEHWNKHPEDDKPRTIQYLDLNPPVPLRGTVPVPG